MNKAAEDMATSSSSIRLSKGGEWSAFATDVDDLGDGQFAGVWKLSDAAASRSHCMECALFSITEKTQAFVVQLPLSVSVQRIKFTCAEANVGDSIHMDVARGVVVGTVKEDADEGAASVVVTESAYDTYFTGCDLVPLPPPPAGSSASAPPAALRYTVTRVKNGVVRFAPALKAALPSGTPVAFAIPVVKDLVLARPGDVQIDLGGRLLPQYCPLTVVYSGREAVGEGAQKGLLMTVEYTTA